LTADHVRCHHVSSLVERDRERDRAVIDQRLGDLVGDLGVLGKGLDVRPLLG
jgi:hypothetical protein